MEIQAEEYLELKNRAQILYAEIGKILCPVFNKTVYFTSEGFNHLIFKNPRTPRDQGSQISRFELIHLAKELIAITSTYQEFEEIYTPQTVKRHKRKIQENILIKYWGVIAIIHNRKIKVIIKQKGENSNLIFWSIIPSWSTNKYRDLRFISTMKGNPEQD